MLRRVAKTHGVQGSLLIAIKDCENGTAQPDRKTNLWDGYYYTASGLFMFTDPTWIATRLAMGQPDPHLELKHNNLEQAHTAAWKIANGGLSAWDSSRWCWQDKI